MKTFRVPEFYRSPVISRIKRARRDKDPRKKDFSPAVLDFGPVRFLIARHFGFCYGVENAIEISFRAVEENPGKRIFLLSQMIHNPDVNNDLISRGVKFLMDTEGKTIIPFSELTTDDVVIIPAFGTTLSVQEELEKRGIEVRKYDTTCPFVERVWNKAEKLGEGHYTVIIHGKHRHEETRATFSRSEKYAPSIVILDMNEALSLGDYISGALSRKEFDELFAGRFSPGFDPEKDLDRVGVINQTTMLATETQAIADHLKKVMTDKFGKEKITEHFADTRDTLCYATNENQESTYALLEEEADLAIVVGGYNSSNTSHLVELCEQRLPTYYINGPEEIISKTEIHHFDFHHKQKLTTMDFLPVKEKVSIILTSGASCPDSVVDAVLKKILSYFNTSKPLEEVLLEQKL